MLPCRQRVAGSAASGGSGVLGRIPKGQIVPFGIPVLRSDYVSSGFREGVVKKIRTGEKSEVGFQKLKGYMFGGFSF